MKYRKLKQNIFTPLILMVVIMSGQILGKRMKTVRDEPVEQNKTIEQKEEENKEENKEEKTETKEQKTYADIALETGEHITDTIKSKYAKKVVKDYCDRKVVACSSKKLERTDEENKYCQTFEKLTGYMGIVRLEATKETEVQFEVKTKIEDVVPIIVFPDRTYVVLDPNEMIQLQIPSGSSTILYIGKNLSGSIKVNLKENADIKYIRL